MIIPAATQTIDSEDTFRPRPPRWPIRVYNGLARIKHVWRPSDPIEAETLLEHARKHTGLQDFGSEYAREGLERLARSLDKEANLHPHGRGLMFGSLVGRICNRLRIVDYLKRKPEIQEEKLRRPLLVTGFGRSGTTLLHRLLSQDPQCRSLMAWEATCPVNPNYRDENPIDTRQRDLERSFRKVRYLSPELETLHALHSDEPEECIEFLRLSFVSSSFGVHANIPGYRKWLAELPREAWRESYNFYRAQLQIVQHDRPGGHFALKCPVHYRNLDIYMETIEEASVVVAHRNPVDTVPSAGSLASVFRSLASYPEDAHTIGPGLLRNYTSTQDHVLEMRKRLPPERICDVRYKDLVKNPLETVRRIYEHLGYTYSDEMEERMQSWLNKNPKNKHGKHRYRPEQFGLTKEAIRTAMKPYCDQYGL